jgi:tetratricopeptide (TPR) repeat protein
MSPRQLHVGLQGCSWLAYLLPELPQLVPQPWPAEMTDSEQARRLMFGAVVRFLANLAGPVGTLLLLDDLQWAGTDALDLLAVLVRAAGEIRLRVVAAYRTTEVDAAHPLSALIADLAREQSLLPLPVGALTPEDARRLVTELLRKQESEVPVEPIVQRAGGVPFFLVSWAHGLQAHGRPDLAGDRVPWTLAQSIRQRVAALPREGQETLGMAAVIGREVPYPILLAAGEQPERTLLIGLDAACQARLLTETGGGAYRFAHDVVREVIEADLGDAHLGLASLALARGRRDAASGHLEAATAIFERTGKQGGRPRVQSLLALRDLLEGQPAAALARLGPLRHQFQLGHDERHVLAEALVEVGEQERAAAMVQEGIEQARTEQRRVSLVGWLLLDGMIRRSARYWEESQAAFEEALSLANTMPYPYGAASVLYELGVLQVAREDRPEGRDLLRKALASFKQLGAQPYIERTERALAELA